MNGEPKKKKKKTSLLIMNQQNENLKKARFFWRGLSLRKHLVCYIKLRTAGTSISISAIKLQQAQQPRQVQ